MKKYFIVICIILFAITKSDDSYAQTKSSSPLKLSTQNIDQVISAMTLEEKVQMVVGSGFKFKGLPKFMLASQEDQKLPERVPGAAGMTHAIPRLGIPAMVLSDGPAGVHINPIRDKDSSKTYYATAFPVATLLASSWDTTLVKKVGTAMGAEDKAYGIDIALGPGMNIQRNPLGGRNFEYFSEDPFITGHMAAAFINGVQSNGVGTSPKHFVANNEEFNRMELNELISERALREIYLRGWQIMVKNSRPWTIMSSYNKVNSVYNSQNPDLTATILRKEWGFKGFVMTDWFGGKDVVAQMKAGNDMLQPGTLIQTNSLLDASKNGRFDMQQLDKNVKHILQIIVQSPSFNRYTYSNRPDLKAHAAVSRMAATESIILLKNDKLTLPLIKNRKVGLFGNTSYKLFAGGTGSGDVNKLYTISLDEGLEKAGFGLNEDLANLYKAYLKDHNKPSTSFLAPPMVKEMDIDATHAQDLADKMDIAIVTIGRNAGEGGDRNVEGDFTLSAPEKAMINAISTAFHAKGKKVVVVLNIGGVIDVSSWRDQVDAILLVWQPGLEGGNAVADILTGAVNPSGKLAVTFPASYDDVPSSKTFPGKVLPTTGAAPISSLLGVPSEVTYQEGIYVGYRYFNTFKVKSAYDFGYGLSYTNFTYSKLTLSNTAFSGRLSVVVTVSNTGSLPGKEIAELYLSAPHKKVDKPSEELKGFVKTRLLKPGESQTLNFILDANALASFISDQSSWIAEAGNYTVSIGASSTDIKLKKTFTLLKDMIVEKVYKAMSPEKPIDELKNNGK